MKLWIKIKRLFWNKRFKDYVYYVTPPFSLLDVLAFDYASDSAPTVSVNPETVVSFDTRSLAG